MNRLFPLLLPIARLLTPALRFEVTNGKIWHGAVIRELENPECRNGLVPVETDAMDSFTIVLR